MTPHNFGVRSRKACYSFSDYTSTTLRGKSTHLGAWESRGLAVDTCRLAIDVQEGEGLGAAVQKEDVLPRACADNHSEATVSEA